MCSVGYGEMWARSSGSIVRRPVPADPPVQQRLQVPACRTRAWTKAGRVGETFPPSRRTGTVAGLVMPPPAPALTLPWGVVGGTGIVGVADGVMTA
ncbi:hypothetical protein VT52_017135 [Streptomyces malaysiense]|uniref:Uncharacterized protein n=1 Tax=Streptomyces malaysiense TaxID=1428626 RepID=A0A1J4Q2A8_9ACTN|nr:hypothetical protein VT52_017135 [Streptomyces malaysiense]